MTEKQLVNVLKLLEIQLVVMAARSWMLSYYFGSCMVGSFPFKSPLTGEDAITWSSLLVYHSLGSANKGIKLPLQIISCA